MVQEMLVLFQISQASHIVWEILRYKTKERHAWHKLLICYSDNNYEIDYYTLSLFLVNCPHLHKLCSVLNVVFCNITIIIMG